MDINEVMSNTAMYINQHGILIGGIKKEIEEMRACIGKSLEGRRG